MLATQIPSRLHTSSHFTLIHVFSLNREIIFPSPYPCPRHPLPPPPYGNYNTERNNRKLRNRRTLSGGGKHLEKQTELGRENPWIYQVNRAEILLGLCGVIIRTTTPECTKAAQPSSIHIQLCHSRIFFLLC